MKLHSASRLTFVNHEDAYCEIVKQAELSIKLSKINFAVKNLGSVTTELDHELTFLDDKVTNNFIQISEKQLRTFKKHRRQQHKLY
jgi:hypothetical protein